MDKLKGAAKSGWDKRPIHRDTISRDNWKSDIKGVATGKKKDPYEHARNHESTPLSSLKDPAAFAPPPKHTAYYPNAQSPSTTGASPAGGLGSVVPTPNRQRQQQLEQEEAEDKPPPEPYRKDTTGLRTDNLPKPPVRRANGGGSESSPARTASPSLPPRQGPPPSLPSRQSAQPPPSLPPRMTENPSEFTPPPPPTYGEAVRSQPAAALINEQAVNRLSHAGVSVPGFGIGCGQQPASPRPSSASQQGHGGQLSELQQRFSRMNTGAGGSMPPPSNSAMESAATAVAAAAVKKAPPPPPKKKSNLVGTDSRPQSSDGPGSPAPPPIPMSSKPKFG